jgi:hypothetical protein
LRHDRIGREKDLWEYSKLTSVLGVADSEDELQASSLQPGSKSNKIISLFSNAQFTKEDFVVL